MKYLSTMVWLVIAAVLLEGLFAWLAIGEQEFLRPDTRMGTVHLRDKLVTWRLEGYSGDRLNKRGERDIEHAIDKSPETRHVILLGDSVCEALQVPMAATYARRLQGLLNDGSQKWETINLGCSGYSTGQELLALRDQGLQYKPDIVALLYSRGDSLENCVQPQTRATSEPRPYFYLGNDGSLQQDDSVLQANRRNLQSPAFLDYLRTNSHLYGVWSQVNFNLTLTDKIYNRLIKNYKQLIARFDQSQSMTQIAPAALQPQDNFAVTQKLISRFNEVCKQNNARFILMTFPDVSNLDPEFARQVPLLKQQAAAQWFEILDLSPAFRAQKDVSKMFLQVHFSEAGHAVVAQSLAEQIKKK